MNEINDTNEISGMTDDARSFLHDHRWAVLATGRRDGSPQQSMVGYSVDGEQRLHP